MLYLLLGIPAAYMSIVTLLDWYAIIAAKDMRNLLPALLNSNVSWVGWAMIVLNAQGCQLWDFMPSWLFLLQKSVAIIWIVRFALYKKPDIGEPPADVTLEQWRHGKEVAERALTIVDLFAALMLGLGMIFSNC